MWDSLIKTKEIIFDKAIELISSVGFENMSMKMLANAVGIKTASMYNHFTSKQEILDNIYCYYCDHVFDNRPPVEESRHIIETGSREEIFKTLTFNFVSDDPKKYKRMILAAKIVMMRIFNDRQANQIFLEYSCLKPAAYVKELLEYGISIGRMENFDAAMFADLLLGRIFYLGMKAFARPDYYVGQIRKETRIAKMLMDIIPLK
ncbi:MAG: TetR/AcrR family transcriptional regulator [Spirochaetaceae bacterium]|nr:TetR/AcrR family transcriptional regulator [Spirochaetaceae bacterium]